MPYDGAGGTPLGMPNGHHGGGDGEGEDGEDENADIGECRGRRGWGIKGRPLIWPFTVRH